jgi:hypothetical protein
MQKINLTIQSFVPFLMNGFQNPSLIAQTVQKWRPIEDEYSFHSFAFFPNGSFVPKTAPGSPMKCGPARQARTAWGIQGGRRRPQAARSAGGPPLKRPKGRRS